MKSILPILLVIILPVMIISLIVFGEYHNAQIEEAIVQSALTSKSITYNGQPAEVISVDIHNGGFGRNGNISIRLKNGITMVVKTEDRNISVP